MVHEYLIHEASSSLGMFICIEAWLRVKARYYKFLGDLDKFFIYSDKGKFDYIYVKTRQGDIGNNSESIECAIEIFDHLIKQYEQK